MIPRISISVAPTRKVVDLARTVALQMAEIVNSKNLFAEIVRMIAELRPPPLASTG